jgi:hypothetical protein
VVLIELHYTKTNLDANAAQAEDRIDAYAPQRRRTAAAITRNTNTAPEPKVVAEEVLRAIEGSPARAVLTSSGKTFLHDQDPTRTLARS